MRVRIIFRITRKKAFLLEVVVRTIGIHPCVGKTAAGDARPTTVVIRDGSGTCVVYEFEEQQLLDLFSCGAPVGFREATPDDVGVAVTRPPQHKCWVETTQEAYEAAEASIRESLYRLLYGKGKKKDLVVGYVRLHVPTELVTINPATDVVGVANGGLGYQVMTILLGRYPNMAVRVIGSGTLKEHRANFDELLPVAFRREAAKVRRQTEKVEAAAKEGVAAANDDEPEFGDEEVVATALSAAAAKDANAKFDAHRIAVALANDHTALLFRTCTLRDRDWAGVTLAYHALEDVRKQRVAAEQQFRQIHRSALRGLVADRRVALVTLGEDQGQTIEELLSIYDAALCSCAYEDGVVQKKMAIVRQAYATVEGAYVVEGEMEEQLERALAQLAEYTELLNYLKGAVHPDSHLPLGKYIGPRIFGRWIAGFGTPMASRLDEPMRPADSEIIASRKVSLNGAVARFTDRAGLPLQPPSGRGATREWLLRCEAAAVSDEQRAQIAACRNAYRAYMNARKNAGNRPLNRVIAFMGLHVRSGGQYAEILPRHQFPRRRKGGRANWNEGLLRQGAYQWGTLIIKGGDSHWKKQVYEPYKARLINGGVSKGHAHKRAFWRMLTVAVRWLVNEWFDWERRNATSTAGPSTRLATTV